MLYMVSTQPLYIVFFHIYSVSRYKNCVFFLAARKSCEHVLIVLVAIVLLTAVSHTPPYNTTWFHGCFLFVCILRQMYHLLEFKVIIHRWFMIRTWIFIVDVSFTRAVHQKLLSNVFCDTNRDCFKVCLAMLSIWFCCLFQTTYDCTVNILLHPHDTESCFSVVLLACFPCLMPVLMWAFGLFVI